MSNGTQCSIPMKDYYKILGVAPNASQDEIKKAYRRLAVHYHPDKNNGDSTGEMRFKELAEAYAVLGNAAKRGAYNYERNHTTGHRWGEAAAGGNPTPASFLILFKNIKNKVFNAGGYINEKALFTSIDRVLTNENIELLVRSGNTATNSLILDEILVASVFLSDASKAHIHSRLLVLANGNYRFIEKIAVLTKKTDRANHEKPTANSAEGVIDTITLIFIIGMLVLVAYLVF